MAFNSEIKGYMTFGKSFSRGGAFPLEAYEIWTDYDALVAYAANTDPSKDPSYIGQKVAYVDLENNKVTHYGIEIDGTLKELGASPIGDEKSIVIGDNNTISLKGVDGLVFERDIIGEDGQPTGQKENVQFQPLMTKDGLIWVEPSKTTVEGLASLIDGLTARVSALENDRVTEQELADAIKVEADRAIAAEEALGKRIDDIDFVTPDGLASAIDGVEAKIPTNNNQLENGAGYQTADDVSTAITNGIANKADKADTLAGYGITNAYTKDEVDAEISDLSGRIDAIDFVDPSELEAAIKDFATKDYVDGEVAAIEDTISKLNHFTTKIVTSIDDVTETGVLYLIKDESVAGIDKYNEYILVDGAAVLIGDTTTDLSDYYTKSDIDGKVQTLEGAITNEATARGQLAEEVEALKAIDNATQAELEAYKLEVTEEIRVAKEAAINDADGKLAGKVDSSDFDSFKESNTAAIEAAKQAAIDAAASAEEGKGYATGAQLTEAIEGINNDLRAYAKTEDVNAELAKKIETGSIAHSSESLAEGVTVDGTKLNIVVDAYTKQEVRDYVADVIEDMTGGESAADVLLALNNHIATYEEKVGQIDNAVSAAQARADKGVDDAAAAALAVTNLTNGQVAQNKLDIAAVKDIVNGEENENSHAKRIAKLEAHDLTHAEDYTRLSTKVDENTSAIGKKADADNVYTKGEADALINAKANAADVYTKGEVDTKVQDAIDAIPDVDLEPYAKTEDVNAALALKANAADVYTKAESDAAFAAFMDQDEVDARINALINAADPEGGKAITDIQNLVKYVDENASEIAALITDTNANTAKLAGIDGTVKNYVDSAIAGLVMPKSSNEVTFAEDGTLGLGEVSTDKLVMGSDTLVIDGGSAI